MILYDKHKFFAFLRRELPVSINGLVCEQLGASVKKSSGFLQESSHLVNSEYPGVFEREFTVIGVN
jgi:hypothetical protein